MNYKKIRAWLLPALLITAFMCSVPLAASAADIAVNPSSTITIDAAAGTYSGSGGGGSIGSGDTIRCGGDLTISVINGSVTVSRIEVTGRLTVNGGTLNVVSDGNYAVLAEDGLTVTSGAALSGTAAGGASSRAIDVNYGGIVVDGGGTLTGTAPGCGVYAQSGGIIVNGGGRVAGAATGEDYALGGGAYGIGVFAYTGDVAVNSGTMTGEGYSIGVLTHTGDIIVAPGGTLTGKAVNFDGRDNESYGVCAYGSGNIEVNAGTLTGEGQVTGVWANRGDISAESGGKMEGSADYYGVYAADGDIIADGNGSQIRGNAKLRGYAGGKTASVMVGSTGIISAAGSGTIYEYYQSPVEAFDGVTPVKPYVNGTNMADFAAYAWAGDVSVSGTAGLLATADRSSTRLTGTRMGSSPGEPILLEAAGTHMIDIPARLSTATTPGGPTDPDSVPHATDLAPSDKPRITGNEPAFLDPAGGIEIEDEKVPLAPLPYANPSTGRDLAGLDSPVPRIVIALCLLAAAVMMVGLQQKRG